MNLYSLTECPSLWLKILICCPTRIFQKVGLSLLKIESWKIFGFNTELPSFEEYNQYLKTDRFPVLIYGKCQHKKEIKNNLFFLLSQLSHEKQMVFSFSSTGNRNVNIESLQASDWVSLQKHKVNECIENRQELTSLKEPQIHLLDYLLHDSQESERLNCQPFPLRR